MPRLHGFRYRKFVDSSWSLEQERRHPGETLALVPLEDYAKQCGRTVDDLIEMAATVADEWHERCVEAARLCKAAAHPATMRDPIDGITIGPCSYNRVAQLWQCAKTELAARTSKRSPERTRLVVIDVTCG